MFRAGDGIELLFLLSAVTVVLHGFVMVSLHCLLVDPAALYGDSTCPFDGHLTDVALRLLFFLFLNYRLSRRCIAIKHLSGVYELDPTLFAE